MPIDNVTEGELITEAWGDSVADAINALGVLSTKDSVDTADIDNDAVTNAKLANMAQATIKGRASGAATGDPTDLSAAQVATIIGPAVKVGHVYIPAGAMLPALTNGATGPAQIERPTNSQNLIVLDFPDTVERWADFEWQTPADWDAGTFTCEFHWTNANGNTQVVRWQVSATCEGDGQTIDQAWGTAVAVDDANGGTTYQRRISPATAAVTASGSPAAGKVMRIRIGRLGTHANDTLASDARLLGVTLRYARS